MGAYYRLRELGYSLAAGTHVVPAEAFEPVAAATALVTDAEARAAAIVAEAEVAYRRRSDEGYEDGLARARLDAVERLLREGATLDAGLRAVEAEMTRVVSACVRKLVADFDDYARAETVVRGALRQMRREKRFELRVSSAHYPTFKAEIGRITAEFPEIELVDVVEDAALTGGQVVVESSIGRVEAEFGESLDALVGLVRGVAGSGPEATEAASPAANAAAEERAA